MECSYWDSSVHSVTTVSGNHSNTVEPELLLRRYLVVIGWRCANHVPLLRHRAAHSAVNTAIHFYTPRFGEAYHVAYVQLKVYSLNIKHQINFSTSKLRFICFFCIIASPCSCCFVGRLVIRTCILTNLYIVFV